MSGAPDGAERILLDLANCLRRLCGSLFPRESDLAPALTVAHRDRMQRPFTEGNNRSVIRHRYYKVPSFAPGQRSAREAATMLATREHIGVAAAFSRPRARYTLMLIALAQRCTIAFTRRVTVRSARSTFRWPAARYCPLAR